MSRMFILTLVRHGETMSNRDRIMQGQLDTKLSDLGHTQAKLVAERLQNIQFLLMFSSDLARAADTARAIESCNTVSTCGLILDKRLRERGFGYLEGKPLSEFKTALSEANVPSESFTPEGGETMDEVKSRAKSFLEDLFLQMSELLYQGVNMSSIAQNRGKSASERSSIGLDGVESSVDMIDFSMLSTRQSDFSENLGSSGLSNSTRASVDSSQSGASSQLLIDIPNSEDQTDSKGWRVTQAPQRNDSILTDSKATPAATADQGSSSVACTDHVLVVSHGLLLRELTRIIVEQCKLKGPYVKEASQISPNTGVSSFLMSMSFKKNKLSVKCTSCLAMNDTSHLRANSKLLITKFEAL
ncbi:unnamed protein product [Lymnaea stagnalis]|uniref:Fructose-2,6-bisphosphatase TIGAR n=1 Tax=Lymnaea stagnalis TaxID=6523 RepID=A0AAV2IB97_LYMST